MKNAIITLSILLAQQLALGANLVCTVERKTSEPICLKQEIGYFSTIYQSWRKVYCVEYAPVIETWKVIGYNKKDQTTVPLGDFADGVSAYARMQQLIKKNYCD